jgi:hypothetical protein
VGSVTLLAGILFPARGRLGRESEHQCAYPQGDRAEAFAVDWQTMR